MMHSSLGLTPDPHEQAQPKLCVAIPTYRGKYLHSALAALSRQDCAEHFQVLISDDASPDNIAEILAPFRDCLSLRYHRFPDNLGSQDLIKHWNRTIQLISAEWTWFIGDDDELGEHAIATVLNAIQENPSYTGIWHLDVDQIDANGLVSSEKPVFPDRLSARNYVMGRFKGELSSFACEYIVRTSTLRDMGGFVNFPHAWCSDDATWCRLAAKDGIRTLRGAKSRWRLSGDNISAGQSRYLPGKIEAMLQYLSWLKQNLTTVPRTEHDPSDREILVAGRDWYFNRVYELGAEQRLMALSKQAWRISQATGVGLLESAYRSIRINRWIRHKDQSGAANKQEY